MRSLRSALTGVMAGFAVGGRIAAALLCVGGVQIHGADCANANKRCAKLVQLDFYLKNCRRMHGLFHCLNPMPTILIADDDPHLIEVLRFTLEQAGYSVRSARNGAEALAQISQQKPDAVVLDVLMPELDGTEVCMRLRASGNRVPILFLSSRSDEIDRVVGLELGGDDYLAKPFSPRELLARVKALLRRSAPVAEPVAVRELSHGNLSLNLDRFEARWHNVSTVLTPAEFGILRTLIRHPGRVYSRDQLMDGAYDIHKVVSDRTMDSHVRRVRAKLQTLGAPDVIETLHGHGYRLGPCDSIF